MPNYHNGIPGPHDLRLIKAIDSIPDNFFISCGVSIGNPWAGARRRTHRAEVEAKSLINTEVSALLPSVKLNDIETVIEVIECKNLT
jgi:hypothetical protein